MVSMQNYCFHMKVLVVLYAVVSSLYMVLFGLYLHSPTNNSESDARNEYDRNTIRLIQFQRDEDHHPAQNLDIVSPVGKSRTIASQTPVAQTGSKPSSKHRRSCDFDQLNRDDTNMTMLNSCDFDPGSLGTLDEAVFKLDKISLPLQKNYRNPCWYERLPNTTDGMYQQFKSPFPDQAQLSFDAVFPTIQKRIESGHMWRLRCLPLVYIIGVAKCGTTDIFQLLKKHPHFTKGATKEPLFWNFGKYKMAHASLADYLDLYDQAAETIRQKTEPRIAGGQTTMYHPMITADASVSYLFRFEGENLPDNRHSTVGPIRHTAHFIKHVTPNAKIILIVRNPTERLYSEYSFFNSHLNTSVEEFDTAVRHGIDLMTSCLRIRHIRRCIYDPKYIDHKGTWVRLVAGMYAPFIKDWISVFPHMKIIRTEDYHDDRAKVFEDVLRYVGLDIVIPKWANTTHITNQGRENRTPMLNSTRQLLDNFYQPFNRELSDLMSDESYLFLDNKSR